MLYWGVDDDLAVLILAFSAFSVYKAYAISRLADGAPRGWYVIVAAFVALFAYWAAQLYIDSRTASNVIDDVGATVSLLVGVLFVVGLLMLYSSFRRRLTVTETG